MRGQASIEVIALLPLVAVIALVAFTLLAAHTAGEQAGEAAEAGALALLQDGDAGDPRTAAVEALPEDVRGRATVTVTGTRVRVRVRPRLPFASLADELAAQVDAFAAR